MQPEWNHTHQKEKRETVLAAIGELIEKSGEEQAELDKLVALSMRTGYELGKQTN